MSQSDSVARTCAQGGTRSYAVSQAPAASYCTNEQRGTKTTKDDGKAVTFSHGASLGSAIGIDLSSSTGFNAATKLVFEWINDGRICGTNTHPPDAARVVAK